VTVVNLIAVVAGAHETAESVGASSVLANVVHFIAFVNVFQNDLRHLQEEKKF
jgi:hypothetical protein